MRSVMRLAVCAAFLVAASAAWGQFVNFESPHVSPIAMSPDGLTLAVCNTPDNRIEVFDLSGENPELLDSIPVGYDPVSVRFRTNSELWAVNHVSDSVSVIDMTSRASHLRVIFCPGHNRWISGMSPRTSFSQANRRWRISRVRRATAYSLSIRRIPPRAR
jgi:hypothetical protein